MENTDFHEKTFEIMMYQHSVYNKNGLFSRLRRKLANVYFNQEVRKILKKAHESKSEYIDTQILISLLTFKTQKKFKITLNYQ